MAKKKKTAYTVKEVAELFQLTVHHTRRLLKSFGIETQTVQGEIQITHGALLALRDKYVDKNQEDVDAQVARLRKLKRLR